MLQTPAAVQKLTGHGAIPWLRTQLEGNSVKNSETMQDILRGMTGTLADKEREYTLEPQPKVETARKPDQTFWGMSIEEWMKTNPLPRQISI